ncbi:MAG: hypothetical protein KAH09_10285, partial [Desulfobacula sp.]|nr:hypothetical protein [Desulfobacula sp.]
TGRAGADGIALSLVSQDEQKLLMGIQRLLKLQIPVKESGIRMPAAVSKPTPVVARKKIQNARQRRETSGWLSSGSRRMKQAGSRAR